MLTEKFLAGRIRHVLAADELRALDNAVSRIASYPSRRELIRRHQKVDLSLYLIDGFVCRTISDRDGGRQIASIHVPGDFVDLHSFTTKRLDHDVETLSAVTVAEVPHDALREIVARFPGLTRTLWFSTMLDAALHRQWIFTLGRLDAAGRIAHFLCELHERLRFVGMVEDNGFAIPLTQRDIGAVAGLTNVHVNRVMGRFRRDGLVRITQGRVELTDLGRLTEIGNFNPDYLYGEATIAPGPGFD